MTAAKKTTPKLTITNRQARRFILAHQGLWPPHELKGKSGVLEHVRRVNCIQFDPLNIVGRNPELVLQARVGDFRPEMLQALLYEDRALVDGWDKMMSIYPVEDWPYFQRLRDSARRNPGKSAAQVEAVLPQVRRAIEERGPVSSIDLGFDQTVDWSWAPTRLARAALESMYSWGELIVHHKVNTRKVYDFARNHIPAQVLSAPDPNRTEAQFYDWYVLRRLGSAGMSWGRVGGVWLSMHGLQTKGRKAALARLLERDQIVEVDVEDMKAPLYLRSEDRAALDTILDGDDPPPRAAILAPLDNLIWDRDLTHELFGFYYRWEVYTPVAKRQYGYYVLPVLYGDRFVARFEPGRDKENGALVVKKWWWEPGVVPSPEMRAELHRCFERFLGYLGADGVQIDGQAAEQAGLDLDFS